MDIIIVFEILVNAISGVFDFAVDIFTGLNLLPYLLGGFTIFTIYRLLIAPLIGGSSGSDSVKKNKQAGDDSNG